MRSAAFILSGRPFPGTRDSSDSHFRSTTQMGRAKLQPRESQESMDRGLQSCSAALSRLLPSLWRREAFHTPEPLPVRLPQE